MLDNLLERLLVTALRLHDRWKYRRRK